MFFGFRKGFRNTDDLILPRRGFFGNITAGGYYVQNNIWNDPDQSQCISLSGNVVTSGGAGGGGIYNSGNLTVKSSTVSGNSASYAGGGIYNDSRAVLTLRKDTVAQNTAFQGADVYNRGSLG